MGVHELILRVLPEVDSDPQELAEWADELSDQLAEADAVLSALPAGNAAPDGAKGPGALVGQVVAQITTVEGLRSVVAAVRGWVSRTGRTVEVSIGGDVLKLTRASADQQEQIINAWLARHASAG